MAHRFARAGYQLALVARSADKLKLKASLPADCARGYSTSRTCEIDLSEQAGFAYQSILVLVERCASDRGEVAPPQALSQEHRPRTTA